MRRQAQCVGQRNKRGNWWNLVADQTLKRMPGYEAIAAGIAGPEIADDVVGQIG